MSARDTPYRKIGAGPGEDWFTRGSRELHATLYEGANVSFEPDHSVGMNSSAEASKAPQAEMPNLEEERGSVLEDRIQQAKSFGRDDHGREDRGLDRE